MLTKDRKAYFDYAYSHLENWFPNCVWLKEYFSDRAENYVIIDDVVIPFSDFLKVCPDRNPNAGIPKLEHQPDMKTLDSMVQRKTKLAQSYFYSPQWDDCSDLVSRHNCREVRILGKKFATPTTNVFPIETLERVSVTMPFSCVVASEELSGNDSHIVDHIWGIVLEVLDADGVFVAFRKGLN